MLLVNQWQHRVLGRLFSDDQLFRIIVPKRFTLRVYPPASETKAGFSEKVITTSGDIRPDFTNEDIALVLQYCWPEEFGDLKACDIDAVNDAVKGVGKNLEPEADVLSYDDLTLSNYCHEKLYNNKARREQILKNFKAELHEARKFRAAAVEERFKHTEPGVLQYIIVAKLHRQSSFPSYLCLFLCSVLSRARPVTRLISDPERDMLTSRSYRRLVLGQHCRFSEPQLQKSSGAHGPLQRI